MQTCVKAVETQVLRSFYADLRKNCRNAAFTQVCVKAACKSFAKASGIGTCVIAAFNSAAFAHHDYFYEALRKIFVKAVEKPAFLQLFRRVA